MAHPHPLRDRWAEDQGLDPKRRGPFPPPAGGINPEDQIAWARYGEGIENLHGLLDFADTLRFPATREALQAQAGDRPVYVVNDFVVPFGALVGRLPHERYETAADLKETLAQEWPSISPRIYMEL